MALIKCSECQREISNRAIACPGCGAPVAAILEAATPEVTLIETHTSLWNRPWIFLAWLGIAILIGVALAMLPSGMIATILGWLLVIELIGGLPVLAVDWIKCRSKRLTVSNKRIRLQAGIFNIRTIDIMVHDVREVVVTQTLLQRLTRTGDLGVSSAAGSEIEIHVPGVRHPKDIAATINSQR